MEEFLGERDIGHVWDVTTAEALRQSTEVSAVDGAPDSYCVAMAVIQDR